MTLMDFFLAPTLQNDWVTLEPLVPDHASDLAEAVGDLHTLWYQDHIPAADDVQDYIAPVSYTHLTLPTKRIV